MDRTTKSINVHHPRYKSALERSTWNIPWIDPFNAGIKKYFLENKQLTNVVWEKLRNALLVNEKPLAIQDTGREKNPTSLRIKTRVLQMKRRLISQGIRAGVRKAVIMFHVEHLMKSHLRENRKCPGDKTTPVFVGRRARFILGVADK